MEGKRVFRFDLIDTYEDDCGTMIASSDDMKEIRRAAKKYIEDTDGECALAVADWDKRGIKAL